MSGIRQFLQLKAAERGVLIRAVPLVAAVQLCLWVIPFRTLHKRWPALLPRLVRPVEQATLPLERIVWLVRVASRFIPGAHCLARAITAQLLLAREGYLVQMRIGVRKRGNSLDAHAWLEYRGVPLFERDAQLNEFKPFEATITSVRNLSNRSQ